jgi:hypothetical protein
MIRNEPDSALDGYWSRAITSRVVVRSIPASGATARHATCGPWPANRVQPDTTDHRRVITMHSKIASITRAVGLGLWHGLEIYGATVAGDYTHGPLGEYLPPMPPVPPSQVDGPDPLADVSPDGLAQLRWYNDPECGAETEDEYEGREMEAQMRENVRTPAYKNGGKS